MFHRVSLKLFQVESNFGGFHGISYECLILGLLFFPSQTRTSGIRTGSSIDDVKSFSYCQPRLADDRLDCCGDLTAPYMGDGDNRRYCETLCLTVSESYKQRGHGRGGRANTLRRFFPPAPATNGSQWVSKQGQ